MDVSTDSTGTGTTFHRAGIFSIANQLKYGVVSVLVLSLLVMAGSLIYLSFQTQQRQLTTVQEERAKDAAAQINAYIDDLQRKLGFLAAPASTDRQGQASALSVRESSATALSPRPLR